MTPIGPCIEQDAASSQIKAAYFKKSKKYHPDSAESPPGDSSEFHEICTAYETLKNKESRRAYDSYLNISHPLKNNFGSTFQEARRYQTFHAPRKWKYAHEEEKEKIDVSSVLYFIGACSAVACVVYYEWNRRNNIVYTKRTDYSIMPLASQQVATKPLPPSSAKKKSEKANTTLSDLKTWK